MDKGKPISKGRRLRFWLVFFFGNLAFVLLAGLTALYLWLKTEVRDVSFLLQYVEEELSVPGLDYRVTVAQAWASWDGAGTPLMINADAVRVTDVQGGMHITLPKVVLSFNLLSLLTGDLEPQTISINKPNVWLMRRDDGDILFGFGQHQEDEEASRKMSDMLATLLGMVARGHEAIPQLDAIQIRGAQLVLSDQRYQVMWHAPEFNMLMERVDAAGLKGHMDMKVDHEGEMSHITGQFSVNPALESIVAAVEAKNLLPHAFADLAPVLKPMQNVTMPINGWFDVTATTGGEVREVDFHLQAGDGTLTNATFFEKPLEIRHLNIKGSLTENLRKLTLAESVIDLGATQLRVTGNGSLVRGEEYLDAVATASGMPVDDLYRYWPLGMAPITRNWVTQYITHGTVTEATATLHIEPQDWQQPVLPEEFIDATVRFEDARVEYLGDMPKVEGVKGAVRFTGKEMDVTIEEGRVFDKSRVTQGRVYIGDMNSMDSSIDIDLTIDADAQETMQYIASPRLDYDVKLGVNPEQISGQARGTVALTIPLASLYSGKAADVEKAIGYSIQAHLHPFRIDEFHGDYNVTDGDISLKMSRAGVSAKGDGLINGVPAKLSYSGNPFDPASAVTYSADILLPVERFAEFQFPELPFLNGTVDMTLEGKASQHAEAIDLRLNLEKAGIELSEIGLLKAPGVPATAALTIDLDTGERIAFRDLELIGEDLRVIGQGEIHRETRAVTALDLSQVTFGQNDHALMMQRSEDRFTLDISGARADIRPFLGGEDDRGFDREAIPAITARVALAHVIGGTDEAPQHLRNVTADISCHEDYCVTLDVAGTLHDDQTFTVAMGTDEEGRRFLTIDAEDAGQFARFFRVADNISGGVASLRGTYDDRQEARPLDGRLTIKTFRLSKAPVLARILSLVSLTGVLNLLDGEGIGFDKLAADFTLEGNRIHIHDAKMVGDSLGMTGSGWFDLQTSEIAFEGTLIPAYTLNSFVGKVPLLGEMLVGKEGEGVFAFKFSVTGDYNEPDISTNPLSVLAPGVLRGIFGVFEGE